MSEVEKLRKEIAVIETKKADHTRKHAEAVQRRAELEGHMLPLRLKMAENDQGARREHRTLEGRRQELDEDIAAFSTSIESAGARLDTLSSKLRRAEREAEIDRLDALVAGLVPASNKLEEALAAVREQSDELFAATKAVAMRLRSMDEERFGGSFEYTLTAVIRESIWHRIEEFGVQSKGEPRPTFFERVKVRLTGAVAQLRYLNLEGNIVAGRGERLYRAVGSSGPRGVKLRHGDVINLRPEEAAELLKFGALEEVESAGEDAA